MNDNTVSVRTDEPLAVVAGEAVWINAGDPPTGVPMYGAVGSTSYDEVNGLEALAGIGKEAIPTQWGPCHMASHPRFGVHMYPATVLLAAREDIALAIFEQL